MQNTELETKAFIEGAEWVLKSLDGVGGGAGRIIGMKTFAIRDLIEQAKKGEITHVYKV